MSSYFDTLKRLEREQSRDRATGADAQPEMTPVSTPVVDLDTDAPSHPSPAVVRQPAVMDERVVGGFSTLFDNLRTLGNGGPVGTIVLCGASTAGSIERISAGLAQEMARNNIRVLVAQLYRSAGQPTLRVRMASPTETSQAGRFDAMVKRRSEVSRVGEIPGPLKIELRGGPVPPELEQWLVAAHRGHEVVIIEGPPLALSIDSAMVARACDGLVLVAEARTTPRGALRDSVERADTVGCQVLGIVMEGSPEWMPLWLRRLAAMRNVF